MIRSTLKKLYMPTGKVHPLYTQYVSWSFLSNAIVSAEYVMSTHSMLSVLGQSSSQTSFSASYIGKDIFGQIGGVMYMSRIGRSADTAPQNFVRRSLCIQQTAMAVECATPFLPLTGFIPVAGMANISQNIASTSIGAVNAKIIQKLSHNNVGEIYAKVSILNTLGSSIGMSAGLGVVYAIPCHETRLVIMPLLAVARIYTYNRAIRHLVDTSEDV